jgi:hypothetical protein
MMSIPAGYEKIPGRNADNARAALDKAVKNGHAQESVLTVRDGYLIPLSAEDAAKQAEETAAAQEASEEFDVDTAKVPALDEYIKNEGLDVDLSLNKSDKVAAIKAALEQKE